MSSEPGDPIFTQLYRLAAQERAPLELDAPILDAADRRARQRRVRARLPWIAAAMLVVLLIFGHGRGSDPDAITIASTSPASLAAQMQVQVQVRNYLLDLRIAEPGRTEIAACLRSRDVCARQRGADSPVNP